MRSESRRNDALVFALAWLPYAALVRHFWFVADDAYISFRYSRNWGAGLGLLFNPGAESPAEGYSNFLMVAAGAAVEALGLDMQFWLPMLCALAGSLLLWLVFRVARERLELGRLPAFLATATLGWAAPFAVWSSSGLEAMPYALFFALAFERLCLRRGGAGAVSAAGFAIALALTRVEGIGWALVVFPLLCAWSRHFQGQPVRAPFTRYLAIVIAGYGGYFAWRYSYFGHAWPMTVYSKVGFTLERGLRGFDYLAVQALTSLSLLAVLPGVFRALTGERRAIGVPLAAIPVGVCAYTLLVGGDWMTFGRFLLPALPFVALLVAWLLSDLERALGALASALLGTALIALGLLPGFDVHLVPHDVRARFHFRLNTGEHRSEWAQWDFMRFNGIRWSAKGRALGAHCPPGSTVVMGAIGAASYVSDLITLDRHGFVTPEVALREVEDSAELRSPGHDKVVDASWFVENGYDPDYLRAKLYSAATREEFAGRLEGSAKRLRRAPVADRYVPDFVQVGHAQAPTWYMVLWTRIPSDESAATAWSNFDARAARFRESGEVAVLEVEPPGSRVPGAPAWM